MRLALLITFSEDNILGCRPVSFKNQKFRQLDPILFPRFLSGRSSSERGTTSASAHLHVSEAARYDLLDKINKDSSYLMEKLWVAAQMCVPGCGGRVS